MSDQEKIIGALRKEIRSLLTAAKDGLTPRQLEQDYRSMIGTHLPLRTLGYRSTMELVEDMPDVVKICTYRDGTVILNAIADEATKKIAVLVSKQKNKPKSRLITQRYQREFISTRLNLARRGRTAPILPAAVKSELKDLLSISSVLLSDFEKAFFQRFGYKFQYTRYGFYSMFEVLHAASDIIQVQQTRAGSLLTLNYPTRAKTSTNLIETNPPRLTQMLASPVMSAVEAPPSPPKNVCKEMTTPPMQVPPSPVEVRKQMTVSPEKALYFDCRLKQLEEEIYLKLALKGAGGTIDPELKEKIRFVVSRYPEGLPVPKLPAEFKAVFEEDLPLKQLGFATLMELVGSLGDILHLEFKESDRNWLVFNAEKKHRADGQRKQEESVQCKDSLPAETLFSHFQLSSWDYPPQNLEETEPKEQGLAGCEIQVITKEHQWQWRMKGPPLLVETAHMEIPPDAVQDICLHSLPLLEQGTMVGVFVENIISPSQFYINLYGQDTSVVLQNMMIEMRSCYAKLAAQAIPSALAWVRPIEGHWTVGAIKQFRMLCVVRPLVGIVYKYIDNVLYIFLCDTSTGEDIYLHRVLKAKSHAIKQNDHFPFKAFQELNPSSLYLKPALKQPVEEVYIPEFVPSPMNFIPKESNPSVQEMQNVETNGGKTDVQEVQDNSLELPYLEPVSEGMDVWDENWSPLVNTVSSKTMATSHHPPKTTLSSNQPPLIMESSNQLSETMESSKTDVYLPVTAPNPEEAWDDPWLPSSHTGRAKMGDEKADDSRRVTEDLGSIQPSNFLGDCSEPADLTKYLEEFYISLIHSKQPSPPQTPANQVEEPQSLQTLPKQPVDPESLQRWPETLLEPHPVSEELSRHQPLAPEGALDEGHLRRKDDLCTKESVVSSTNSSDSNQHTQKEQISSMLPAGSWTFPQIKVPRSTLTASLGAAARLATAGGLLHWKYN
ncbi:tudor domain-containing protein 5 isoform X2 [Rhinatrema bivittatum]|uniref:tudor domain-containing protein 5 isoform X2 n=1 Tax=Rhinatrema bivittatum TaxID=194408 RepID=UPI001129C6A3|nr:tudor domain-containing protein 5 isoform X2 [Rhinatrema bivittatum]